MTEIGKSLIDEGKKEKAIKIEKNLLDILSVEMISKTIGLTIEKVEKSKKSSENSEVYK